MILQPGIDEIVELTLREASAFLEKNRSRPEVSRTFGYFVEHPVASLNKKRFCLILDEIQKVSKQKGRSLKVLDIASGGGLISYGITLLGHQLLALDLSAEEVSLAQEFFKQSSSVPGKATFEICDLVLDKNWETRAEKILGARPDLVLAAYSLHHLPQVEKFIQRLGQWLPKDAILLVNEENPHSPLFRLKHVVRTMLQKDTETEWHQTISKWKTLIEANSFCLHSELRGADPIGLLGRWLPQFAWSIVFSTRKF